MPRSRQTSSALNAAPRRPSTSTPLASPPKLNRRQNHTISVVVDRLVVRAEDRSRLVDSLETALKLAEGLVTYLGDRDPCSIYTACSMGHFNPEGYAQVAAVVHDWLAQEGMVVPSAPH